LSARTPLVCGFGDNVVDRYPDLGMEYPGGNACNVAVFARRSDATASYIGVVGSDASARHLLDSLSAEGVDVSRVRTVAGGNSHATVKLDDHGNREFLAWEPIEEPPPLDGEALELLAAADLVHTGHASFTEALLPALAERTRVSFDFSYKDLAYAAPLLPAVWAATFSGATLSEDEARDLLATVRGAGGPEVVLVTRGAAGALVAVGDLVHHQAAAPAAVVDTLGAGDAFTARLLVGLLRDEPLASAAQAAAEMAAGVCESLGAFGRARALDSREVSS
jgi:fructoselysine 6-kinase